MNISEGIAKRKSIRSYTEKQVEIEKIESIIMAGNSAPIAGKIHFTVIRNAELLESISEISKNAMLNSGDAFLVSKASSESYVPTYNAPVMIVVSSPTTDNPTELGTNTANTACAAQNMLLEATELNLGSCYVVTPTFAFAVPEIKQSAGIEEGLTPLCAVLIGYTDDKTPHAERSNRPENVNYC